MREMWRRTSNWYLRKISPSTSQMRKLPRRTPSELQRLQQIQGISNANTGTETLRQKQPRKKEEQQPPTNINLEQSVPKLTQINRPQSLTKTTQFSAPQHKNATYAEIVKHKEKSNAYADRAEMPDLTLLINAMFERIENLVKRLLERTMDRMIQLIGHVLHSQK